MNFMRVCRFKFWLLVLSVLASSSPHLCSARDGRDYLSTPDSVQVLAQYADPERVQQSETNYMAHAKSFQTQAHDVVSNILGQSRAWWNYFYSHRDTGEVPSILIDYKRAGVVTHLSASTPEVQSIADVSKDGSNWTVSGESEPRRTYFYSHNETRIAMARAEAAAEASRTQHDTIGGDRFPSFPPSKDVRCNWNDLEVAEWDSSNVIDELRFVAVDSRLLNTRGSGFWMDEFHEVSCRNWHDPIQARVDPVKGSRSFNVSVQIRAVGLTILAEGVYFPATGRMHLVGCTQDRHLPDSQRWGSAVLQSHAQSPTENPTVHPVESNSSSEVCAMAITLQYPPVNPRWNSQRVLKFVIRSMSGSDDPAYVKRVEQSIFFPYRRRGVPIAWQRSLETAGRVLLQLLGIICVAKQIGHGRNNEEALPFVSLGMVCIQLAHHFSQTTFIKGFRIGRYLGTNTRYDFGYAGEFTYYAIMAWREYVPYQATTMAALFMYVWIFQRVGDRRRIMQLRVRKKQPGAAEPPSDKPLVFASLAIFCIVGALVLPLHSGNDTQRTAAVLLDDYEEQEFLSLRDYGAQPWEFVTAMMGMVSSLFLVPQLVGNWRWEVQGRPLSAWLYVGLPCIQSLPHVFSIAKYVELVPIFEWYDPYLNSLYGNFQRTLVPWREIGLLICSALLVLAVHFQFAAATLVHRSSAGSIYKRLLG